MTAVIRAKNYCHTFNILDGAGFRLAAITLYNMKRSAATDEARKVAKSLSPQDWTISYEEHKPRAEQFIDEYVEVRS